MKVVGITIELTQLFRGQGRAQAGDDVHEAELVGGDHVHVAFDDNDAVGLANRPEGTVQSVNDVVICERGRVSAVFKYLGIESSSTRPPKPMIRP